MLSINIDAIDSRVALEQEDNGFGAGSWKHAAGFAAPERAWAFPCPACRAWRSPADRYRPLDHDRASAGMTGNAQRPRRPVNHDSRFFSDGLARGHILIQRCADCGRLRHPPRPMCARCQAFDWDVIEASGHGHIYSYAVHHHPPLPGLPRPNVILLVDTAEGVRMFGDLVGAPDDPRLAIGAPVTAEILADPGDDMLLVRWRLDEGNA